MKRFVFFSLTYMFNMLKINFSVFIFTGKMGKLGMAVMVSDKPGALTQLLPLSIWFSESNRGFAFLKVKPLIWES